MQAEDARKHAEALLLEATNAYNSALTLSPVEVLDALDACVNGCTSAQGMDALCGRLRPALARAEQRRGELQQVAQKRKIEELENRLTCPICLDHKKNVSCVPCGHALCRACADAVSSRGNRKCPFCREDVQHTNPIFL